MKFQLTAQQKTLEKGLEILLNAKGHQLAGDGICILPEPHTEKTLTVSWDGSSAVIGYCHTTHFFRGVGLLLQHLSEGSFSCTETVWLDENGLMLDCSRNAVYKTEFVRKYLETMAFAGMNVLYLYLEDTYEVPEYPYFGLMRGRYSQEELKAIDSYAAFFGIEVVPCIQTLAHMRTFLRWPSSQYLRDTDNILLAEDEQTCDLIRAMLRSLRECFSTRRIHLGMDEAEGLGTGRYLLQHGYQDPIQILQRHLARVMEYCREFDFHPMIWSDMYFKLADKNATYYDLPEDYQWKEEEKAPDDLTLVYWDYYNHDEAVYRKMVRLHQSLASHLVFAGGGWIWNGLAPNYSKAMDTTRKAMHVLHDCGLRQAFCTLWSDNSSETPQLAALLSMLFFSEFGFHEDVDEDLLNRRLLFHTGVDLSAWMLLDQLDAVPGTAPYNRRAANPSKQLFYQDPLLGLFDAQTQDLELDKWYQALAEQMEKKLPEIPETFLPLFRYYHRLASLLSVKSTLGQKLTRAYLDGDRETIRNLSDQAIPACIEDSRAVLSLREQLWMDLMRPQGFEVVNIRMSGVTARLEAAKRRLDAWLQGTVDRLPELEDPRLPYDPDLSGDDALTTHNLWEHLVTASNMYGV